MAVVVYCRDLVSLFPHSLLCYCYVNMRVLPSTVCLFLGVARAHPCIPPSRVRAVRFRYSRAKSTGWASSKKERNNVYRAANSFIAVAPPPRVVHSLSVVSLFDGLHGGRAARFHTQNTYVFSFFWFACAQGRSADRGELIPCGGFMPEGAMRVEKSDNSSVLFYPSSFVSQARA